MEDRIEFECDFCHSDIISIRHRFNVDGVKKDSCDNCFLQGTQGSENSIQDHKTYQPGEAEKEDYEDYFECTIDQILSFGMHPYQIVSIENSYENEDTNNNLELIISNEFYEPDAISEAAVVIDNTMLNCILKFFKIENTSELLDKIFLTNERSASDAMQALALVFADNLEKILNSKNSKKGPAKKSSSKGKLYLKYLRKPQTAEDLTNKIVDSFCKLELTDLSFLTGSEKLNYLKKIFGVTNETEDTMERDSVDHIHQWFNNVAELVREKSSGQIVCEIASPSCKFPNLVEVPYDFRFQIFKANEGDSPSSPYLLVQLAPFGAGWYCHRLQN